MENRIVTVKDENVLREYKYEIVESVYREKVCYGISIKRTDYIDDIIVKEVKDSVKYITPNFDNINDLMNLLADKNVSPLHLIDVLSEREDEFIEEFRCLETKIEMV